MHLRRIVRRSLRFRNLIMLTLLLMMLYFVKNISLLAQTDEENKVKSLFGFKTKTDYFVPSSLKKIDWHNYKQIAEEKKRVGIGEQGKPATVPKQYAALEQKLYSANGFNGLLSDLIPLNRSIPDIRHPKCKDRLYIESLPTVSVIVPFYNEHLSTLLRTAYSVIHRSPKELIKEIFFVDDASSKVILKQELEDYLSAHMPNAHVIRLANRSGLITARLEGAKRATADVLLFLDAHSEANVNWLPPLLEPIALNHRVAVCPFIDVVAFDTFEYRAQDEGCRGSFDWEFYYKRLPILPKDEENMPEPFDSPVMAGGLFAISRAFFWELGGYDPALDIWGGEQYELSFKIWQCGGRMVDAPCSRIGHVYRGTSRDDPNPVRGRGDFIGKNYRRVAEVWMDEYAEYLYNRRPHYREIDPGNLTEQKAVRERLKCKPFKWFMTQVAFDLIARYPPIPPKPYAEGRIKPVRNPTYCLDMHNGGQNDRLKLTECSDSKDKEQMFELSWHKDVRSKKRMMCWDVPDANRRKPVLFYSCHLGRGNQEWRYHPVERWLRHSSGKCVDYDPTTLEVFVSKCSGASQWTIDTVYEEVIDRWDEHQQIITGPVEPWTE